MNKFLVIFVLCFLMVANFANAETLSGIITDSETDQPLPHASIMLEESNKFAISDEQGEFKIENLGSGEYTLKISYIGYGKFKKVVKVPGKELTIKLIPKPIVSEEIWVTGTRAEWRETPVTFTNISKETIENKYYGQDIPMLLDEMPNVFSYSESGSGFGYTYLKVRGFDQRRIGVMINGIPLNDPEDHQVYWVDMPDFGESTQDIQVQRGVGSSVYGVSTFGGSVNLLTTSYAAPEKFEIFSNYGSYNSQKYGAELNYNIYKNYKLNLRFSRIKSDGYRDNSGTEMWSYYGGLSHITPKSLTELKIYGGNEKTHAAWYASAESDLEENHQHNPVTYDNEIDDFNQPHFELHNNYYWTDKIDMKNSLFYIRGDGYYEQYKDKENLWEYGLAENEELLESDLVRQKHVEKNHYGWIGQVNYRHKKGKLTLGTYLSLFDSKHWGEVDELKDVQVPEFKEDFRYYDYIGEKSYVTFYVNEEYKIIPNLNVMANLYFQKINYQFDQREAGNFVGEFLNSYEVDYDFFNPRFGLNYNVNENINFYGNVSIAQREPTDSELYDTWDGPDDLGVPPLFRESEVQPDGSVKWSDPYVEPEKLTDFELGAGYTTEKISARANFFWMNFENEIIPYGGVDDDGSPIRGNAEQTVHRGVELSLSGQLPYNLAFSGNFAYNDNYFEKFTYYDYDWDTWETVEFDYSGNQIAGFPDILANMRLTYTRDCMTISGIYQHVGKQYLDNTEDEDRIIEAYNVFNSTIILRLDKFWNTPAVELSLHLNNILDEKFYTAGYYDAWDGKNYYWPGAERNFMAGLRFKF